MFADLLAAPGDERLWAVLDGLQLAEREAVVDELKALLDVEVRARPAEAAAMADVLFRVAMATPTREAVGYRGRAVARHVLGQSDEALLDYERAIELYTESGADLDVARLQRALIDLHHLAGRNDAAMAAAAAARSVFERLGEERQLAQLEVNVGNVHFRSDRLADAAAAYAAAAARFRALGDETGLGIAEYNRGNVEVYAGRYPEAAQAYGLAHDVFTKGELWAHVAECDYARAWMLSMRCRFAEAIPALEAARALFEKNEQRTRAPLCDLDLAELYLRLDARWDALEHASRAAAAFEGLGLAYELAKALSVRGMARLRTEDMPGALADWDQAQALLAGLDNQHQEWTLRMQRAAARHAVASDPRALDELRWARTELAESGNSLSVGVSRVSLARALTAAGCADEAVALVEPLTVDDGDDPRGASDMLLEVDALRVLGEAQLALDQRTSAMRSLSRAVERIDATLALVPGSDARTAFFRDRHGAFVDLARLFAEDGRAAEGLAMLERGRARESRQRETLRPEAQALRERLDTLLLRRLDADLGALTGNAETSGSGPSDDELLVLERQLASLLRERGLDAMPSAVRTAWVQPGEVALSYLVQDDGAGVFVTSTSTTTWVPLATTARELTALSERLDLALRKRRTPAREAQTRATLERVLAELGELLLAPLEGLLPKDARLVIVPYGALHGLAFHALDFRGRALILSHEVGYALALSRLVASRARTRSATAEARVLLTAGRDTSLPEIATEAEALQALWGPALREVPPEALRPSLAEPALAGGLLHLAAHGAFQPHNPLFSGLSFGTQVWTAQDVRGLDLELELVTLSGCETGRSGRIDGEALVGIDQAFLAAGARAVVSSLWVVDDALAARWMASLHARLAAGQRAGAALAEVQREAYALSTHPFDWAPFVLVGDLDAQVSRGA